MDEYRINDTCVVTIDRSCAVDVFIDGKWATNGSWDGKQLLDAAAPIGDDLYDAIEDVLRRVL